MTPNLASLSQEILRKVLDFCEARDALALSSTCRSVQHELRISILSANYLFFIDRRIGNYADKSAIWPIVKIPIFFPNQLHSATLTCRVAYAGHTRLYVVAKPEEGRAHYSGRSIRDKIGNTATVVWESSFPEERHNAQNVTINFRSVPYCQDYFLWCQCAGSYSMISNVLLKCQLLWNWPVHHKQIFTKCLELELMSNTLVKNTRYEGKYEICSSEDYQSPGFAFLSQLFHWTVATLSEKETSPLHTFFQWETFNMDSRSMVEALKTLSNIYEQSVEQKEPEHCKAVLLPEEHLDEETEKSWPEEPWIENYSMKIPLRSIFRCNMYPSLKAHDSVGSPVITLEFDAAWVPSDKVKGEVLQFVARIPLVANAKCFWLQASLLVDPGQSIFFLFPTFRGDSPNRCKDMTFGSMNHNHRNHRCVITLTFFKFTPFFHWEVGIEVHPDATAYFLYLVPNPSCSIRIDCLRVILQGLQFRLENPLEDMMKSCIRLRFSHEREYGVPAFVRLTLLRAAVLTLMNHHGPKYQAIAEFLEREGFSTTTQGLDFIVQQIDLIIEQRLSVSNFLEGVNDDQP